MIRFVPALAFALTACATVPKESVELSATVGRDIAVVHQAHRRMAELLFGRMRADVDRFVDGVYAPAQLAHVMQRQGELASSQDEADQAKSLIVGLQRGFVAGATPQARAGALLGMQIMVRTMTNDIESMRAELRAPLNAQEAEVLGSIDRAYYQIHYANSIVTGHLASVVKVQDAQDETLKMFGVDRDLRTEVAGKLAHASDEIASLVGAAGQADKTLDSAEETANKLKAIVRDMGSGNGTKNGDE